tara:strand:+ start:558 stop:2630 length:2073 start_codon:yes stop_codon:yes gene_type:complete
MAEQIISPGVFQNENVPITLEAAAAPIGAAIIGPSVKGQIGIPVTVSSYSEYLQKFGGSFVSGGLERTYFTALSAQNYFRQGGSNLLVTRVASGSSHFTAGESTNIIAETAGSQSFSLKTISQGVNQDSSGTLTNTFIPGTTLTAGGSALTGLTVDTTHTFTIRDLFDGGAIISAGLSGSITIASDGAGEVDSVTLVSGGTEYTSATVITISAAALNATTGTPFGTAGGGNETFTFSVANVTPIDVESAGNALPDGTADNLRFEISNVNAASGIFDLFIRQGNDRQSDKIVLESWRGVSLDPTRDDYISKVIGNQQFTVGEEGSDSFVNITGEYPNKSNYVVIDKILHSTPNYLDGAGNAVASLTGSLPIAQSGSFLNASGSLNGAQAAGTLFYDKIVETNTQGLIADNYTSSINLLRNKDQYNYNVISTPGLFYSSSAHATVLDTLITNTTTRGDSILPIDVSAYGATVATTVATAATLNTNYAAAYWPWLLVKDENTGANVWSPASTIIPSVYAFNDTQAQAWFAPAGFTRGTMPNVVTPEKTLPRSLRDTLYTGKVNPIATFPGTGVVVYGQKTLQNLSTALDRVNVRRLLITLKDFIGNLSQTLVFEPNSLQTRNSFLSVVNPYLEGVQQNQGIYAFKVIMDDSNNGPDVIDRNELRGAIYLQPVKTAEFIVLDFNLLPTGAEFPA